MGLFQGYTVRKSILDPTDERCKGRWAFFQGYTVRKSKLDDTDERCKGRWAFFQGYTVRKSKLDDTDEMCKGRLFFFRDTLSENQNWMIQLRGIRVDGPTSGIH
jgi:hypothetical protein